MNSPEYAIKKIKQLLLGALLAIAVFVFATFPIMVENQPFRLAVFILIGLQCGVSFIALRVVWKYKKNKKDTTVYGDDKLLRW